MRLSDDHGATTPPRIPGVQVVELDDRLHGVGDGVHWALAQPSELNANLVLLEGGHAIARHANTEVDVLMIVLRGTGVLTAAHGDRDLAPNVVAHIPIGAQRTVRAGADGLAYLSVHRRRGALSMGRRDA